MPKAFDSNFLNHINWRTRFYSNSDALIINPSTHIWYFSDETVDGFPNLKCCDFWVSGICHCWREQDWETRPCQGEEWGRWQNCICICIFFCICNCICICGNTNWLISLVRPYGVQWMMSPCTRLNQPRAAADEMSRFIMISPNIRLTMISPDIRHHSVFLPSTTCFHFVFLYLCIFRSVCLHISDAPPP